jgi:hypothetical protein
MKNIEQVLRDKEADIERLQREIKVLRVAARLLEDGGTGDGKSRFEEPPLDVTTTSGANGEVTTKRWP